MPAKKKVADLIADFLERHEIRHVFGIVGAGNAHIFDAIGRKGYTEIVCVHHEQAATMAMQTYYRVSGKVTAALLTTGGGSTNGMTGVVSAWMDSLPGLVISGNENSKFTSSSNPLRVWGVQGYDSVEMVRGVTKYAVRVMDPNSIEAELEKSLAISNTGRPGPCWIDVPMDVQAAQVDPSELHPVPPAPLVPVADEALRLKVSALIADLLSTERPVIWLGQGIRLAGALDSIPALLDRIGAPSLVSWAGVDMVESQHPLAYGRAGVYGQRCANFVLQNSDYVLAIGTRLAIPQVGYDMSEFARAARVTVVDIDADEVVKHGDRVHRPICADAKVFMEEFLAQLESVSLPEWAAWRAQCDEYRSRYPWIGPEHAERGFINSYRFMDRICDYLKPDQVIVTDMGTALLSGFQTIRLKQGQRLMTSTGLGEMGFGLPAAIGASFARERGEVLCLNCDGGMMMNLQELQTIAHHHLPIKIIIFNNDGYLMIKHTQKALFKGRYVGSDHSSGVSCPDFSEIAHAFGFNLSRISTWDDFEREIPTLMNHDGPMICEIYMEPEQPFFPKLSVATRPDGSLVSPPLEDLSPLLPRDELREAMIIGLHPKSESLVPSTQHSTKEIGA